MPHFTLQNTASYTLKGRISACEMRPFGKMRGRKLRPGITLP